MTPSVTRGKTAAASADCSAPDSLGTSRILPIPSDAAGLRFGLKTYKQTLALAENEIVLTFDDGPSPETTPMVLDALKRECVSATFFLIGRNAKAHPDLVKREIAEGHTVGHHSNTHPAVTLRGLDDRSGMEDIDAGIAAVEHAGYADPAPTAHPHVPFFRFPGFADSAYLLTKLGERHVTVFGADFWAADWLEMTPDYEMKRLMDLLERPHRQGGIVLFHDTRPSTAAMLPRFLRALKAHGFKIAHLVPDETAAAPPIRQAPSGWSSETDRIIARVWPKISPGKYHALAPNRDETTSLPEPAPQ